MENTVKIKVDSTELDEIIEKTKEILETAQKAQEVLKENGREVDRIVNNRKEDSHKTNPLSVAALIIATLSLIIKCFM